MLITKCLIIILLACIVWQDFSYRAVYWFLLPLLTTCLLLKVNMEDAIQFSSILVNLGIIAVQLGALSLYVYAKDKKWHLHTHYLGWGDVLFFCALAFYFPPILFLGFQIVSLLITCLGFAVYQTLVREKHTIPLAGCQAALLILLITSQSIAGFSDADIWVYLNDKILGYAYGSE